MLTTTVLTKIGRDLLSIRLSKKASRDPRPRAAGLAARSLVTVAQSRHSDNQRAQVIEMRCARAGVCARSVPPVRSVQMAGSPRLHERKSFLPRGQHKCVSVSIESRELALRHGIDMDKALPVDPT
jgi:hypothetical protein